jgi:hypothetical protein
MGKRSQGSEAKICCGILACRRKIGWKSLDFMLQKVCHPVAVEVERCCNVMLQMLQLFLLDVAKK